MSARRMSTEPRRAAVKNANHSKAWRKMAGSEVTALIKRSVHLARRKTTGAVGLDEIVTGVLERANKRTNPVNRLRTSSESKLGPKIGAAFQFAFHFLKILFSVRCEDSLTNGLLARRLN